MFYDKFKQLCEQKDVSCTKAAVEMGLSNATPTKWKKTGATPAGATLSKVASYFGVPISTLIDSENLISDSIDIALSSMNYGQKEKPTGTADGQIPFAERRDALAETEGLILLESGSNRTGKSIDEAQLVGLYNSLNEQGKKKLLEYAADLIASGLYANSKTGSISEKYAAFQTTNIRDQIDVAAAGGIDIPLETAESGSTANEPEDLP